MRSLLFALLLSVPAFAENVTVTISWNKNPEPDVNEYRVYIGTTHGIYGAPIITKGGALSAAISLPKGVMHYAAVKAVNTIGLESPLSEELVFQAVPKIEGKAPSQPVGVGLDKVAALSVSIEQTEDLVVWQEIYRDTIRTASLASFFRLVLSEP